jgi:hypothetical protein|tara:strand:- start:463 stop:588 length:126 start_codon:yes stop_codon:yes gene_type:complete
METKKELREEIKELMNLHDFVQGNYPQVFNAWYESYYYENK